MTRERLHMAAKAFRRGVELGYPRCCALHFAVDRSHERGRGSAWKRGAIDAGRRADGEAIVYVPCLLHMWRGRWYPFGISTPSEKAEKAERAARSVAAAVAHHHEHFGIARDPSERRSW